MAVPGQRLEAGENVYSAWLSRGGDYAAFRAQLIDKGASTPKITVTFYHKNVEDAGDGTQVGPAGSEPKIELLDTDANGAVKMVNVTDGLKELVRLKFACTGDWMRFRMLMPAWYDAARVS